MEAKGHEHISKRACEFFIETMMLVNEKYVFCKI